MLNKETALALLKRYVRGGPGPVRALKIAFVGDASQATGFISTLVDLEGYTKMDAEPGQWSLASWGGLPEIQVDLVEPGQDIPESADLVVKGDPPGIHWYDLKEGAVYAGVETGRVFVKVGSHAVYLSGDMPPPPIERSKLVASSLLAYALKRTQDEFEE